MAVALKAVTKSGDAIPQLADFPEYVAARAKLREIATEHNAAATALDALDRPLRDARLAADLAVRYGRPGREDLVRKAGELSRVSFDGHDDSTREQIHAAAMARIQNGRYPARSDESSRKRPDLELAVSITRVALALQGEKLDEVRNQIVSKIMPDLTGAHASMMKDILAATLTLSAAMDRELQFRLDLGDAGILTPAGVCEGGAFSGIPAGIRTVVGSRKSWSSGVNALGRSVDPDWDHSPVKY